MYLFFNPYYAIDIQYPYQKEPKLARARQIPEWEEYDSEIARLSRSLAAEGKIHSRMATADANVLAGAINRGEELDGKILKEGDSEEQVAIERTLDEL